MMIFRSLHFASRLFFSSSSSSAKNFLPRRLLSCPSAARLSPTLQRDDARRVLTLTWENDSRSHHPFTFLKDSCPCSACAHPTTLNRRNALQQLDLGCTPEDIRFDDDAAAMTIEWNDKHKSVYSYGWLLERCFLNPKKEESFPVKIWDKGHQPEQFEWQELVTEDSALFSFLRMLKIEGFCLVKNAPSNDDGLNKLVKAIGFSWRTTYGEYFDVLIEDDPCTVTYTSEILYPHTDQPYYAEPPGIQFLHGVTRTADVEGGQNQIADGFFAAETLRREDPEAYHLLCETSIHYSDCNTDVLDFDLQNTQKMIKLDEKGNFSRIVFSTHYRDSRPCVPLEKVELYYRALKRFEEILLRESLEFVLHDGTILVFNNHRVLHGRSAYHVTGRGMRYVRGTYITWDILNSRFRRLQAKLTKREAK